MVPVVTFATSPAHTSSGSAKTTVSAANNQTRTINNRCGTPPGAFEGPLVLKTLNKGQEIEGSATATSDGDDPTAAEQEALSIYAEGLPFIQIILPNTGPHHFEFTARTNGVKIDACWVLIRQDDEPDFGLPAAAFFAIHKATATFHVGT